MEWWSIGVMENCQNDLRFNTPSFQYSITPFSSLAFFHLPILQFHRRIAAENIHCHFQFAAIGFHFLDHSSEIKERAIVNFDGLANLKADFRFLMLFGS